MKKLLAGIEMGSDHEVFQAAGFRVPMVYFHDYPDVTHTQKDQPENLDATKLGRVAYLGAGIAWTLAALPDSEAPRLLDYARGAAEERIARARMRGVSGADLALGIREAGRRATRPSLRWPASGRSRSCRSTAPLQVCRPRSLRRPIPGCRRETSRSAGRSASTTTISSRKRWARRSPAL